MLCAKTLKAAKAALILILGAWATMSAHAAMNISGATDHAPAVYAAETVSAKAFTDLKATNGTFDVVAWSDVSLTDATYHYRYDLSGSTGSAIFTGGTGITLMVGTGEAQNPVRQRASDLVFSAQGAVNRSTRNAKNEVIKGTGDSAATDLTLNLDGANPTGENANISATRAARVQVKAAPSTGTYKFNLRLRIYSQLDDALSGAGSTLYDSGAAGKPIIAIDPTLSVSVKKSADLVADVAHNFTKFHSGTAGATSGTLATVQVKMKDDHCSTGTYNADGSCKGTEWPIMAANTGVKIVASGADVLDTGSLMVKGNHSLVDLKLGTASLTLRDGLKSALKRHTEGANKGQYIDRSLAVDAQVAIKVTAAAQNLTANVGAKNAAAIPAGSYTATVTLTPKNANAAPVAGVTDAPAGTIKLNGTTVHLGYLTGHDGYNQRVIIVNRGTTAATYALSSIQTEDGTTATGGTAATGSVPAGGQTVVRTGDLINFESGRTRAAATLALTAPKSAISVSTTIVNLSDGSTDTSSHMVQ